MAMNLNDGFDDDELDEDVVDITPQPTWTLADNIEDDDDDDGIQQSTTEFNEQIKENEEEDALTRYLKDNGIADKTKIKFEDEEGNIEEKSWDDLTVDEQLNILRSNESETGLDDSEIEFINFLREKELTPTQYQQALVEQIRQELQAQLPQQEQEEIQPNFTIDQYTDDELFILDLQSRIEDITDEEIQQALINAKQNEDFYAKQMKGIRAEYQRLETEQKERDEAIRQQEQQNAYIQYSNTINNQIANLSNIGDLDITMEPDDMDQLSNFILGQDENGEFHINKALQDPETMVKMAWFALHGEEIFNGLSQYYNQQLVAAQRDGYQKGLAAHKEKKNVVTTVPKQQQKTIKTYRSVDDLDED